MRLLLIGLLTANVLASDSVMRIRYERTENAPDEKGRKHLAIITGHGTAFGLDLSEYGLNEPRYLLTCRHNLFDTKDEKYVVSKVEISSGNLETWARCSLVAEDKNLDLCLIKVDVDIKPLKLGTVEASAGSSVRLIGSPRGIPISEFTGVVASLYYNASASHVAEVKMDHGNSGGPLLQDGVVVGVAVAGIPLKEDMDPTKCLYVPIAVVKEFLRRGLESGTHQKK